MLSPPAFSCIDHARPASRQAAPALVLDTNVVLDWLVFRHPACAGWTQLFAGGKVHWLASAAMRGELAHVLQRGVASSWAPDLSALWAVWDSLAKPAEPVSLTGAASRIRCTDADDQKFIDLALGHGARWLLSRDRAVLKLARRVRPLGLDVLTPEAWLTAFSAG
ncbi:putative toxin-antitoxin system toxin component, PIN family [Piscinibacter sp.]|jgi:predicted nucleic acid-binding protein|uniref:PIN domain-containing protein n=1 Tax=Piscinibacter sp. TaxID=1903157 RepID=UPI00355A0F21